MLQPRPAIMSALTVLLYEAVLPHGMKGVPACHGEGMAGTSRPADVVGISGFQEMENIPTERSSPACSKAREVLSPPKTTYREDRGAIIRTLAH